MGLGAFRDEFEMVRGRHAKVHRGRLLGRPCHTGTRLEQRDREALAQAQRVEQELHRRVAGIERQRLGDRGLASGRGHVTARVGHPSPAPDAPRVAELGMRSGTQTEVIAEPPVVDVVTRMAPLQGERRDLVMDEARAFEALTARHLLRDDRRIGGQDRWAACEGGARLQRQLVVGEVGRLQRERRLDVGQRLLPGLPGQAHHQVEIQLLDSGLVHRQRGRAGLVGVMDAA